MQTLTSEDIIKLAAVSDKAASHFINMAKLANGNSSSEFNETAPAADSVQNQGDKDSKKKELEEQEANNPDQMGAIPATEEAPVEVASPEGPESAGARAAKAFLGPEIMQAAISGDPGAQDLVSRTAGQVAGAVTESITRSAVAPTGGGMAPAEGGMVPGEGGMQPGMAAPAAVASPEEDLANEIVPAAQAIPVAPMGPNGAPVAPPGAPAGAPGVPPGTPPAPAGNPPAPAGNPATPSGAPAPPPAQSGEMATQGQMDQGKGSETQVVPNGNGQPASANTGEGAVSMEDVKKLIELAKAGKI